MKKLYLIFLLLCFSCEEEQQRDITPPSVIITYPETGTLANEIIIITCMSSDNQGVDKVELWANGESTGITDNSEPYSFEWNTIGLEDRNYTIIIRSYDLSGNISDSRPIILTVDNTQSNPQAVDIESIIFENGGFNITWEQSYDGDFSSYRLEKSLQPLMDSASVIFDTDNLSQTIPVIIERSKITSYFEEGVDPLINQYYRVTVKDTFDFETKGQVFSSAIDPVPIPVDVISVAYDFNEVVITWRQSLDGDFRSYKLLYSDSEIGQKDTITILTDIVDTVHTMGIDTSNFNPTHQNWFWVMVNDTLDQVSLGLGQSNSIDSLPSQSELYPILYEDNTFFIVWSQNYDNDFKSYRLYESLYEDMSGQSLVYFTTESSNTSFTINVQEGEYRYYQLVVEDVWGLSSASSIIIGDSHNWFVKTFTGNGDDIGSSVIQADDDGYVLLGTTNSFGSGLNDLWLIKTDSYGNEQWSRTFGGIANDVGSIVQKTLDGGYIIIGTTASYGNGSDDIWLIKTTADGDQVWNMFYGENGSESGAAVQQTNDGGYILVGKSFSEENNSFDIWLIKTDSEGNRSWSHLIGGPGIEEGFYVQQTTDNGYIIVGTTTSYGNGMDDIWLIKTDSEGNRQWNKTFGGAGGDKGFSVDQAQDEGYFITGCFNCDSNESNVFIIKTNREGQQLWSQNFGGSSYEWGRYGHQTDDGGYIITGLTTSLGDGSSDAWLIRTDSQGQEIWNKTFGGVSGDGSSFVQQTNEGGYIFIGYTTSFESSGSDIWLIKTDSSGDTEPYGD